MTDLNLNVYFDYENNTTSADLISLYDLHPNLTGQVAQGLVFAVKVHETDGTIIQSFFASSGFPSVYHNHFTGKGSFGLQFEETAAGIDTAIQRTDNSGVHVGYWQSNWELSEEPTLAPFKQLFATGWESYIPFVGHNAVLDRETTNAVIIDRRDDNAYIGKPLVITEGDAVIYGKVDTVTQDNLVTLSHSAFTTGVYTNMNLNDSIGQVISGSNSGEYFSVIGLSGVSDNIIVGQAFTDYSGQQVKIMPYRTVSDYSGWDYSSGGNGNKGGGGVVGRFGVSETIPTLAGSLHYTSGTYSGTITFAHPNDPSAGTVFPGSTVALVKDDDLREVKVGDLIFYNPSTDIGATNTGVIVRKGDHSVAGEGDYAVTYWPSVQPHADSEYTIYRNNDMELQSFPELDREYIVTAEPILRSVTGQYMTLAKTPSATLEFSANEYPSTFATVAETSHFHVGPVYLSNGQMLDDRKLSTNTYMPILHFSGEVINGDPTAPTTVVQKTAFSTQNADIAHMFSGTYVKDGIMTMASSTTFNAAETLICKAVVNYGSIKIDRTFTVPVQPTV